MQNQVEECHSFPPPDSFGALEASPVVVWLAVRLTALGFERQGCWVGTGDAVVSHSSETRSHQGTDHVDGKLTPVDRSPEQTGDDVGTKSAGRVEGSARRSGCHHDDTPDG